jgi:DNA polymerase-1
MKKKIYIIDWNNFIYRMFYAIPEFTTKDWRYVNAVFGMAKFIKSLWDKFKPDYIYFVRDSKEKNFREEFYPEYKWTRDKAPDNLKSQFDLVDEMIWKTWIKIIEIPGYEADDVIWTLATKFWQDKNNNVYILSWDKDLYSLVQDNVKIKDTMKKKDFGVEETIEKFGIKPEQVIDYLAIVWDKSDNIPGLDWFWPKKAQTMLEKYGTLEEIYNNSDDFTWKTWEKLIAWKENAFLSKRLATIVCNINLEINEKEHIFDKEKIFNPDAIDFLNNLEFYSITWWENKDLKNFDSEKIKLQIIKNNKDLEKLNKIIDKNNEIVLDTETTSLNYMEAQLVGISLYINNIWYYINIRHSWDKIDIKTAQEFLENLLNSDKIIIWHNLKYDLHIIYNFLEKKAESNTKNDAKQVSLF